MNPKNHDAVLGGNHNHPTPGAAVLGGLQGFKTLQPILKQLAHEAAIAILDQERDPNFRGQQSYPRDGWLHGDFKFEEWLDKIGDLEGLKALKKGKLNSREYRFYRQKYQEFKDHD